MSTELKHKLPYIAIGAAVAFSMLSWVWWTAMTTAKLDTLKTNQENDQKKAALMEVYTDNMQAELNALRYEFDLHVATSGYPRHVPPSKRPKLTSPKDSKSGR